MENETKIASDGWFPQMQNSALIISKLHVKTFKLWHFLNLYFNNFMLNPTLPDDMLNNYFMNLAILLSHWRLHLSWAMVLASVNCFSASFLASEVYIWWNISSGYFRWFDDLRSLWISELHAYHKTWTCKSRELKRAQNWIEVFEITHTRPTYSR